MPPQVRGMSPPGNKSRIYVHRVTTSDVQTFICLSRAPYGQPIHWWGNRSHECTSETGSCEGCREVWPRKWKAYFSVIRCETNAKIFLEITEVCYEELVRQLPIEGDWRGLQLRIRKTKGGPKGRYLTEVLERRVSLTTLPEEEDPLPLLRQLWRCKKGPLNSPA